MKKVTTLVLVAGSLALPSSALADGLGYSSLPGGVVQEGIQKAPAGSPAAAHAVAPSVKTSPVAATTATRPAVASKGSLPFTGLDVGLVAIAGGLLLGTGLALRKASAFRSAG